MATAAATKRKVSVDAPLPPLDPRCPPRRVRHRASGVVTGWSTLFRKRIAEFEPFYRNDDERVDHMIRMRRYEAQQAMKAGDPFAGSFGDKFSSMAGGETIEGDFTEAQ